MTDHGGESDRATKQVAPGKSRDARLEGNPDELIDRVEKLRTLLPTFAQETAVARREAARLRSENAMLQRRVVELEARSAVARDPRSRDARSR
jgi:hypothetical protein